MEKRDNSICKSIFKDGKHAPTREEYTALWVAIINRLEKSKKFAGGR